MTNTENSTAEQAGAESAHLETQPEPADAVASVGSDTGALPVQEPDAAESTPVAEGVDLPLTDAGIPVGGAATDIVSTESAAPEAVAAEPERPAPVTDEVLLASVEVARAALLEITPESTIGEVVGHVAEDDHVLSLFFDSKLPGYPGWHWTVTLARVGDDGIPTILETELMPGEHALLAPDWVPWSERLADYQATQEVAENEARLLAEAAALLDEDEDDEDEFSILHAGDVDGVDVDEIDDSDEDESDDDDSDEDDDDDDDDDDESDDDDSDEDDDEESDDDDSDDDDDEESDDDGGAERSY